MRSSVAALTHRFRRTRALPCWLALLLAGASACGRTPEAKPDTPSPVLKTPESAAPSPTPQSAPLTAGYRLPGSSRVVAIGDIHGDLTALRGALRLAGAIDTDDRWIGKDLTVVQTGDQIDRGDQDREVLDVLEKLEGDAKAAGGKLLVLLGNHELMNAGFDFRYVTRKSFTSFDEFSSRAGGAATHLLENERGRAAAFAPGAPYALKLSQHLVVAQVGDTLFAHGGVLPAHVDYGLDRINLEAGAFMAGKLRELPRVFVSEDAPQWVRVYGSPEVDDATCQTLGRVLTQVGAKRLVVGHTVQEHGISSACQERLFRIDIGLSAYYGIKPPQVLEITAAGARVLGGEATPATSAARPSVKQGKSSDAALHSPP
jgi:Calcineurin-like phosphoesterase